MLITGCAHEGIVKIAHRVTEMVEQPLALLLGGFHLFRKDEAEVHRTADELLKLDIRRIAPCHCTGDPAIEALQKAFAEGFVAIQAGSQIDL